MFPNAADLKDSLEEKLEPLTGVPGDGIGPTLSELSEDLDRLCKAQAADAYREVLRMLLRHYFLLLTGYLPETLPLPLSRLHLLSRESFTYAANSIDVLYNLSPILFPEEPT